MRRAGDRLWVDRRWACEARRAECGKMEVRETVENRRGQIGSRQEKKGGEYGEEFRTGDNSRDEEERGVNRRGKYRRGGKTRCVKGLKADCRCQ